jgi:hypothetical protein
MGAFMIGVYEDHRAAEQARTELVAHGFATDRVELTSSQEPGQAATLPADTLMGKLEGYYSQLFEGEDGAAPVRQLVERVRGGGATITAHPRGEVEVQQARETLQRHRPVDVIERGVESQSRLERAATGRPS